MKAFCEFIIGLFLPIIGLGLLFGLWATYDNLMLFIGN